MMRRRLPPWHRTHLSSGTGTKSLLVVLTFARIPIPDLFLSLFLGVSQMVSYFEVLKIFSKCFFFFWFHKFSQITLCYFSLSEFDLLFFFFAKMNCLFRTVFRLICIARAAPRRRSRRRFRRFVWFTHCCFPNDFVGSMLRLLLLRCQRQLHVSALFCILRAAIAGECCCAACDAPANSPTQLRAGSAISPQGIVRVCGWESCVCIVTVACTSRNAATLREITQKSQTLYY